MAMVGLVGDGCGGCCKKLLGLPLLLPTTPPYPVRLSAKFGISVGDVVRFWGELELWMLLGWLEGAVSKKFGGDCAR